MMSQATPVSEGCFVTKLQAFNCSLSQLCLLSSPTAVDPQRTPLQLVSSSPSSPSPLSPPPLQPHLQVYFSGILPGIWGWISSSMKFNKVRGLMHSSHFTYFRIYGKAALHPTLSLALHPHAFTFSPGGLTIPMLHWRHQMLVLLSNGLGTLV